jgi:ferrous iron transport protein A
MLAVDEFVDLIPVSQLAAGASAVVAAVLGGAELVHRLHEMGLRRGARVEMVQPGSPCIVKLDQQKLGFRCDEVVSVLVRPGGTG